MTRSGPLGVSDAELAGMRLRARAEKHVVALWKLREGGSGRTFAGELGGGQIASSVKDAPRAVSVRFETSMDEMGSERSSWRDRLPRTCVS